MQIIEAKHLFEAGQLKKIVAIPSVLNDGWYLLVERKYSRDGVFIIQRQRGGEAVYKTLNAAFSSCLSIGFQRMEVSTTGI